jgi:hypothetical protein
VRVGLVDAVRDPQLLGGGVELWPRQVELLADVDGGARFHVWALGRRSGKTTSAALVALWDCLLRDDLDAMVRRGERRHAVCVATNHRQARLFVQAARSIVLASPLLAPLLESSTEDELEFVNGTAVSAFPCTSRGARGWPISCLLLDEFAHFHSETDGPAAADRVFEALVPSTAQFGGLSRVIVSSTPYGQAGMFADLFRRASTGELADAVAHHAATAEMNPTVEPEFLVAERARDPEGFEQEYEASFLSGGAAYLDPRVVADAVVDRPPLEPGQGFGWVAGLDPAFSSDPFGLAIVGRDAGDQAQPDRLVLGLARRWRPSRVKPASLEEGRRLEDAVLAEVADECLRYGAQVVTDQYRAAGVVDYLRRRGLSVRAVPMTASSKTDIFAALRAELQRAALELYEEPVLLGELRRLRTRYAAGRAAVEVPRSGDSHGDVAQALALAVWASPRGAPGRLPMENDAGDLGVSALRGEERIVAMRERHDARAADAPVRGRDGMLELPPRRRFDRPPRRSL